MTDQVIRDEAIRWVEASLKDILSWMQANMLKQNADKTEVIIFTSERNAGLVNGISVTVHYANMSVQYTAIFHGCKNDNFR